MRYLLPLIALAGAIAAVRPATAIDYQWIAGGDAVFNSGASWDRSAVPGPADRAIFDRIALGGLGGTSVDFTANHVNERLVVRDDDIVLRLNERLYRLTNLPTGAASLIVAEASGDIADLRIENGTLQAVQATLGLATGSDGIVEVSDATWTNSHALVIGASGAGELIVESAGQVSARSIALANTVDNSFGHIRASGAGSLVTSTEQLIVGNVGYGEFFINDGAVATSAQGILGAAGTSTGIASIDGAGATWHNSQSLVVGDAGYGELNVFDGGLVSSAGAQIARQGTSTGIATIFGGAWQNTGDMHIGGSAAGEGGTGTLVVDFGAEVMVSGATRVHPDGLLSIRGGTFQTGSLVNAGGIEYLLGVLHLTASDLVIGDAGVIGPVLALTPDMHTIVDQHTTVDAGAHIAAIEGSFTTNTLTNNGRLSIIAGAMEFVAASTNTATGRISIIDGVLATGAGADRLVNQGRMDLIDATINGDLHNAAGSLVNTGGAVMFAGAVSGEASFSGSGHVTFAGDFRPGNAAAAVSLGGDVSFTEDAALFLQLGGAVAGSEYDQLQIAGAAALAGTLNVSLTGGFIPAAGQTFALATYAVHSGQFEENLPPLPDSLTWNLDYGPTSLLLSVASSSAIADLNGDGVVDRGDVAVLTRHFGKSAAVASEGDLDNDGAVSLADLLMLQSQLAPSAAPPAVNSAAVPEPAAWQLVAACAVVFARRRFRSGK